MADPSSLLVHVGAQLTQADANLQYELLVQRISDDIVTELRGASTKARRIATALETEIHHITKRTPSSMRKASNEKVKLYLTEAVMALSEATGELIAHQSRMLLAASLKDQCLDPRCDSITFKDRHFKMDFGVYCSNVSKFGERIV
jgi:hypothetical protein